MGTEYALTQTEADRKIFEVPFLRLDAGPFFDSGKIATPSGRFGSPVWLDAAGLEAKVQTAGGVKFRFIYGRDLNSGRGVFYTGVSR